MQTGIKMIAQERIEQIYKHGYTLETDRKYITRDILKNAAIAILTQNKSLWLIQHLDEETFDKIMKKEITEQIACAGAFLAAEIDYINYKSVTHNSANSYKADFERAMTRAKSYVNNENDPAIKIESPYEVNIISGHNPTGHTTKIFLDGKELFTKEAIIKADTVRTLDVESLTMYLHDIWVTTEKQLYFRQWLDKSKLKKDTILNG